MLYEYNVVCNDGMNNKLLSEQMSQNEFTVNITLQPIMLEGWTAYQCRSLGATIDYNIPDCAIIKNGKFEWVTLDFVIDDKN